MLKSHKCYCALFVKQNKLLLLICANDDAPPHSLKDSNASLKVKAEEEEGIGVHSLTRNILWAERSVETLGWGLE